MSEGKKEETGLAGKVRGVALLQWTGPRVVFHGMEVKFRKSSTT